MINKEDFDSKMHKPQASMPKFKKYPASHVPDGCETLIEQNPGKSPRKANEPHTAHPDTE